MVNRTNTAQGINVEHLFANSIFNHPKAWNLILESIGYRDAIKSLATAKVVGGNKRKADVEINFPTMQLAPIRVSVKSFRGAGYNHLERRNLLIFCERNQISKADTKFLERIWIRKARESGKGKLVHDDERERVEQIFSKIEPAVSSLLGNDHPQIMALYSLDESEWRLYNMNKQVLPLVRSQRVSFTKKSSNIEIGHYVVIQRKGSAKGEKGSDPFSLEHGSNDVQIKMRVKKFWDDVKLVSWYRL